MATERLNVILTMTASQYTREAQKASSATGQITKSQGQATKAVGGTQSAMSGLAATAKFAIAGAATAAVTKFASDSIRAASDLNESINAVNVVFGDSADQILAIGENAATSFGLAQSEFNGFAVQFSSFAETVAGESGQSVAGVVNDLTNRIADFASVMNLDVPEAAEKFQSGLAGQTEPLRKFGIDVSAAAVNAKALELGLADSSAELTEQDKILARYELIMEQTADTAGDFLNTSDQLANSQRILSARIENAQAAIGKKMIPVVAEATDAFADLVTIIDGLLNLIPGVESAGEVIGNAFNLAFFGIPDLLDEVAGWFAEDMPDVIDATANFGTQQQLLQNELVDTADKALLLAQGYDDVGRAAEDTADNEELLKVQTEAAAFAMEREQRAAKASRDALLAKRQALRQIHNPLFRAVELNSQLADAEEAVTDAIAEFGADSIEAIRAAGDFAAVNDELIGILEDLRTQGIDPTGAAARLMFQNLGVPPEVVDAIFATFDEIERNLENRSIVLNWEVGIGGGQPSALGGTGFDTGTRLSFQHGGRPPVGVASLVGERGPELFVPDRPGTIIPNGQFGTTINNTITVGEATPQAIGQIQTKLLLATLSQWSEVN